jgi:hypothetical protein
MEDIILDIAIYLLGHGVPFERLFSFLREKHSLGLT